MSCSTVPDAVSSSFELQPNGALGRSRTDNLLIRSQMLYPLSYERLTVSNTTCRIGIALPVTPKAPSRCADTGGRRPRRSASGQTFVRVM
jgi:hypothetical protein